MFLHPPLETSSELFIFLLEKILSLTKAPLKKEECLRSENANKQQWKKTHKQNNYYVTCLTTTWTRTISNRRFEVNECSCVLYLVVQVEMGLWSWWKWRCGLSSRTIERIKIRKVCIRICILRCWGPPNNNKQTNKQTNKQKMEWGMTAKQEWNYGMNVSSI